MKVKKVNIPIYGGQLIIIKTDDLQAIANKYGFKTNVSNYGAFTFNQYDKDVFKCYTVFQDVHPSLIAHETVHVVNYIYEKISAKLDIINDEPQAYLTGWAFDEIHKFLTKNQ